MKINKKKTPNGVFFLAAVSSGPSASGVVADGLD
jgi:hypothetical protein